MPGANCSVLGCGSNRRMKGMGIFQVPIKIEEWRKRWLDEITKTRVVDADFKRQISEHRVHACERHFYDYEIEICKFMYKISLGTRLYDDI